MGYARELAAVAPLNGRTHELKSTRSARGRKPVPTGELEKELRRAGNAFVEELFPAGRPPGFEINLGIAKWRLATTNKWSQGRVELWCRVREVNKSEAARQIQNWLAGKNEFENATPQSAKPEPQAASRVTPISSKRRRTSVDVGDVKTAFAEFAAGLGLVEPKGGGFIADCKLHRCDVAGSPKDKKNAGSYHLFSEGGGWAQNWTNGAGPQNWSLRSESQLTEAERAELRQQMKKARREYELEEARRHKEAAREASEVLNRSVEATADHPYLKKKGLGFAFGLRLLDGKLVMPLHDEIWRSSFYPIHRQR